VAGPVFAFEDAAELLDVDPGLEARRVDLLERRHVEDVHACVLGQRCVALLAARVSVEVFALRELRRVDEQAHDDDVVLGAGRPKQREMSFMEGAHRRHEPEGAFPAWKICARADGLHRAVASAKTS
jgi:hypothetical protein